MTSFLAAFAALLVVAGPWKAVISFAEKTSPMERPARIQTALLTTGIALAISIALLFFGKAIVDLFKIEAGAFMIGAGLIVVVFAIQMVVSPPTHETTKTGRHTPMAIAIYPLSIPLLITPPAVATLTVMGVDAAVSDEALTSVLLALAAVMAVNLIAFLILAYTEDSVPTPVWDVAGRLLGIFLVAFGVTVILQGLELVGY